MLSMASAGKSITTGLFLTAVRKARLRGSIRSYASLAWSLPRVQAATILAMLFDNWSRKRANPFRHIASGVDFSHVAGAVANDLVDKRLVLPDSTTGKPPGAFKKTSRQSLKTA